MAIYRGAGGAGDATTDTSIAVFTNLTLRAETAVGDAEAQVEIARQHKVAAATSAGDALTLKDQAGGFATAAGLSATSASNSAQAAADTYDAFDDRYLGAKASDPTVDNDGDALATGALYYNTVALQLKVYTGATWAAAAVDASGFLTVANNLSDLNNAATARTNLGLGTAATTASTDYATAAQGALADSATQPGDNVSTLTNDAGYLTSFTETDPVYLASSWYTTTNNAANWNTAYGWGNHATAGYAANTNVSNWDTAYSWGNHATAGYLNSTSTVDGGTY